MSHAVDRPSGPVRQLGLGDAELVLRLRREALETAPLAFGSAPADEAGRTVEDVRASLASERDGVMLGGFDAGKLVGMLTLRRENGVKRRHRAAIVGLYVTPSARGGGLARALLDAAITLARAWGDVVQLELSVTDAAPDAQRLYERAGFRVWGRSPRALRWDGRYIDMVQLALDLDSP